MLGKFGYGNSNAEGRRLLGFCLRNAFTIGNGRFQKREIHVVTRYSWNGEIKNVINDIITCREWGGWMMDVKVIPSMRVGGDHRFY